MVQRIGTVAFEGIEARAVDVQVQVAPGLPAFKIVETFNPDLIFLFDDFQPSLREAQSLFVCATFH